MAYTGFPATYPQTYPQYYPQYQQAGTPMSSPQQNNGIRAAVLLYQIRGRFRYAFHEDPRLHNTVRGAQDGPECALRK